MAVYTHITKEEAASILAERYGIHDVEVLEPIAEGIENSNYLVRTTTTKYILTLFEKRVNPEELPFFMALMEHLSRANIACPTPIALNGGGYISPIKDKAACMVSFLEGAWPKAEITTAHCAALGSFVSRMRQAVMDFPQSRENGIGIKNWPELVSKITTQADDEFPGLSTLLADELAYVQQHWPQDLPGGVIHADVFPDNVFYQGNSISSPLISGIIDFYFACNEPFVYEIAIVLNAWCFDEEWQFVPARARAFLESYQSLQPLTEAEKNALPVLVRGAALRFLLSRTHDWIFRVQGALVTPKNPAEYLAKLKFWQSNPTLF